jgi:hypothetical protein
VPDDDEDNAPECPGTNGQHDIIWDDPPWCDACGATVRVVDRIDY